MELSRNLRRRARKHAQPQWLLFVGDSDTRGLVLSLLQVLAEAGHSLGVAENSTELWLGRQDVNVSNAPEVSRICQLDALYDDSAPRALYGSCATLPRRT